MNDQGVTFQLWINGQLDLAGCEAIETCKRKAKADAYNEAAAERTPSLYHIRTNEGSTIFTGQLVGGRNGRMKWRRP